MVIHKQINQTNPKPKDKKCHGFTKENEVPISGGEPVLEVKNCKNLQEWNNYD